MSNKKNEFSWLQEKFGVNYLSLDKETRELVQELGQSGVEDLIKTGITPSHRGETDLVFVEERLQRIKETGGLNRWRSRGARKVVGTKPTDWVIDEENDLYRKMFERE